MDASPFDTLKMVERLESVGVPAEQARMHASLLAEAMSAEGASAVERFADKQGVSLEFALIKATIEKLEIRLEAKIDKGLADLKSEMIRWVVSVGILQTALIAGLVLKLAH